MDDDKFTCEHYTLPAANAYLHKKRLKIFFFNWNCTLNKNNSLNSNATYIQCSFAKTKMNKKLWRDEIKLKTWKKVNKMFTQLTHNKYKQN